MIDDNLMTVGEIAKEANVSVRTMQYYDKCGLLKPSAYSEGGNRLYSSKDLVMLLQILALKDLGLSLDEIKQQLVSLDDIDEVMSVLHRQKTKISENIRNLQETLIGIEILEKEITRKKSVNFAKYAKIIADAQNRWGGWWQIEIMPQELHEYIMQKFEKESMFDFAEYMMTLFEAIAEAQRRGVKPKSPEGQMLVKKFWNMIQKFTEGKTEILNYLLEVPQNIEGSENEFAEKWKFIEPFIVNAMEYLLEEESIE